MLILTDKELDRNLKRGSSRRSNHNVQIVGQGTLKIGSSIRILQTFQSSQAFARTLKESNNPLDRIIGDFNESKNPQDRIIGNSNKSTNPQDRITETFKESKSHICTQKPLNLHKKRYTYTKAA